MISSAKNSYVRVTYYPNKATQDKLKKLPKEILKEFARSILNDSSNLGPFRTGNMWKRTISELLKNSKFAEKFNKMDNTKLFIASRITSLLFMTSFLSLIEYKKNNKKIST